MLPLQEIRSILEASYPELVQRYPIKRLGIFGSVARGEARPESDIDLLVEFHSPVGMEIVYLADELETLLGRTVDLVSKPAIQDRMLPFVEKDLIYVAA
ncbi:MAG: nucleotidyltransferase family protein [Bacteroidota bacterium]